MGLGMKSTQKDEAETRNQKPGTQFRIRRGRRTDFVAVMNLLAASAVAIPPPDRATLRRFRNIVGDLGVDFYLALFDETLAGLVHVTYARQLTTGPRARLDQLVVADAFRRRGVGSALLAFVQRRARKRGCTTFCCPLLPNSRAAGLFLEATGFGVRGQWFIRNLQDER
jgi:GNAT superfamily N-acetyltransferase